MFSSLLTLSTLKQTPAKLFTPLKYHQRSFIAASILNQRFFSTSQANEDQKSSREELFTELLATAEDIKDYNYRNYFVRRLKEDMSLPESDQQSAEDLMERLSQLKRIRTVQNLYYDEPSVIEKNK